MGDDLYHSTAAHAQEVVQAAFGEQSRRLFTACRCRSAVWQEGAMTSGGAADPALCVPSACLLPAFAWRLRQSDVEAASGVLCNPTDCGRQRRNTIHVSPRPHLMALDITAKPPCRPPAPQCRRRHAHCQHLSCRTAKGNDSIVDC